MRIVCVGTRHKAFFENSKWDTGIYIFVGAQLSGWIVDESVNDFYKTHPVTPVSTMQMLI